MILPGHKTQTLLIYWFGFSFLKTGPVWSQALINKATQTSFTSCIHYGELISILMSNNYCNKNRVPL